jgi:hypothetical protein
MFKKKKLNEKNKNSIDVILDQVIFFSFSLQQKQIKERKNEFLFLFHCACIINFNFILHHIIIVNLSRIEFITRDCNHHQTPCHLPQSSNVFDGRSNQLPLRRFLLR